MCVLFMFYDTRTHVNMQVSIPELRSKKLHELDNQLSNLLLKTQGQTPSDFDKQNFRTISLECMTNLDINPAQLDFETEFSLEGAEMLHKAVKVAIINVGIVALIINIVGDNTKT